MPGATQTPFFEKAGMLDTPLGRAQQDDPLDVALTGFAALMSNKGSVVYGIKNKLQVAATRVAPASWMAEAHRMQAKPSGGQRSWVASRGRTGKRPQQRHERAKRRSYGRTARLQQSAQG